jgi:NAD(P)-dependent dehydrogenase (short-subunit alcohol dehydrogenase family)
MSLAFVPLLKKAGEGRRILNIASIMGMRGWPNAIPYSTAKGAIANFTRALAADLAPHGIVVNALAPGFVNTPMSIQPDGSHEYDADWFRDIYVKYGRILLRRYAEPEDMAGPAFFLCSDDARYVTGQILMVDGGASATFGSTRPWPSTKARGPFNSENQCGPLCAISRPIPTAKRSIVVDQSKCQKC